MTYVPSNLYEVRIYDHAGSFQIMPYNISRLEFHQRINLPWNHQITIELSVDDPLAEELRAVTKDWFIVFYRTDPISHLREKVYEGWHITTVDQARITGDLIFNLYGSGFTQMLQRRVVIPPPGLPQSVKTGAAETVFKSYVSDCMVSPLDITRIFPGVTLEPDAGGGELIDYSSRYTNLMTVCENIADAGKLDFGVKGGQNLGEFVVCARELWGKDRRYGNPAGNIPTVFSLDYGNMTIPIFSTNSSDEKNYVYVGGGGEGENRIITAVSDPDAIILSPWGRKEAFVEGRQEDTITGLVTVGRTYMEQYRTTRDFTFDLRSVTGGHWMIDWELGDLITARYFNNVFDKKIIEVGVVVSGEASADQSEVFTVEMEDARL